MTSLPARVRNGLGRLSPPTYVQHDEVDCGPTCLRMVAKYHQRNYSLGVLRRLCAVTRQGASVRSLGDAAERIGMRTLAARIPYEKLCRAPLPCIAHTRQAHFVVVYRADSRHVLVADPSYGLLRHTRRAFTEQWCSSRGSSASGEPEGVVLLLEPTPRFYELEDENDGEARRGLEQLIGYLRPHRKLLLQVVVALLLSTAIGLVLPFLTQSVVDLGIGHQNLGFVHVVLIAQLALFAGRATVEIVRARLLLHVGHRVSIAVISDFLAKLMRLPVMFFGSRQLSDVLTRIHDHQRLERFLTFHALQALFAAGYLIVFASVLAFYKLVLFLVLLASTAFAVVWMLFFQKRRREMEFRRLTDMAESQGAVIQLINGIADLKVSGAETQKRWQWERVQARIYRINSASLSVEQIQEAGVSVAMELKDIAITFLSAREVIAGNMTLGMMMAVQYVIGQMGAPIRQLVGTVRTGQDARIAMERLGEIQNHPEEELASEHYVDVVPTDCDISLRHLSFRYAGAHSPAVLDELSLEIPAGKVTAIVGPSGSGKTTLLKLLLKLYEPTHGDILVGGISLRQIRPRLWRGHCGAVMQDGYLFADTIARNIALGDDEIDPARLRHAADVANILEHVQCLALGFNTKIGAGGDGLSQGQRQRLLIARAIYTDPSFLLFDEATSALDAKNERTIMENLAEVFPGRTVVVIAHRLSTVRSAHQIAVLDQGRVVERGSHEELTRLRGAYFSLVKNQLELGA